MSRTVIETFTGQWVDYAAINPADITLRDIARSLSQTCRFNGLIPFPWSVADHALLVRSLVIDAGHPELALAALHHDSHEAFLSDLPTPLKNRLDEVAPGVVEEIAGEFDWAIAEALLLDADAFHAEPVVEADLLALRIEAWHLKPSRGIENAWPWREPPPVGRKLERRTPDEAANAFVNAHVGHWGPVYA